MANSTRLQQKKVVCMLDEAHLLGKDMLEELRFLLNYKFDFASPMSLVLVIKCQVLMYKKSYINMYNFSYCCTSKNGQPEKRSCMFHKPCKATLRLLRRLDKSCETCRFGSQAAASRIIIKL